MYGYPAISNAAHTRARQQRQQARAVLAVNRSRHTLAQHHGGGAIPWQCWHCRAMHLAHHTFCVCRRANKVGHNLPPGKSIDDRNLVRPPPRRFESYLAAAQTAAAAKDASN